MKIYIKVDPYFKIDIYPWRENIEEHIKETTSLISEEYKISIWEFFYTKEQCPYFPSFIQEDIHARYIRCGAHHYYFGCTGPYYHLLFVWEPADFIVPNDDIFDEDDYDEAQALADAEGEYNDVCRKLGLPNDYELKIPDGFVYIGSYVDEQDEPLSLPGLKFEEDDDGTQFLAPCMFTVESRFFSHKP